jgi:hypothetical protein
MNIYASPPNTHPPHTQHCITTGLRLPCAYEIMKASKAPPLHNDHHHPVRIYDPNTLCWLTTHEALGRKDEGTVRFGVISIQTLSHITLQLRYPFPHNIVPYHCTSTSPTGLMNSVLLLEIFFCER